MPVERLDALQNTGPAGLYPVSTSEQFILVSYDNVQFRRPFTEQWMEYSLNRLGDNVAVRRIEGDPLAAFLGDALVGMRTDGTIMTLIKLVDTDSTRLITLYRDKIAIEADTVFIKDGR